MLSWDAYSEPEVQLSAQIVVAEPPDESPHDPNAIQSSKSSTEPIRSEDKRVINDLADINQLAPFKYPWAWRYFLNANKNHWTPLDINMSQDVYDYRHTLSDAEKHLYENVLPYLTTSDILAMRNIGPGSGRDIQPLPRSSSDQPENTDRQYPDQFHFANGYRPA